ncbi:DUF3137 domain-containing protein [Nostoc sp.]|uniref:DUF3137 domain-containing protein n=1 Tax=Nostoc sp. TaxID=1180 RepID=UPI002FFAA65C
MGKATFIYRVIYRLYRCICNYTKPHKIKNSARNIYISFVYDIIYSHEETGENNLFDSNLYKSMLSFAPLRKYFESLNLMLGIVEDLNLDRRILHKATPN